MPQNTGGLIPVGLVTVTVSPPVEHEAVVLVGCWNTAESKSNLNW